MVLDVSAAAEIIFCRPGRKKLATIVETASFVLAPSLFTVENLVARLKLCNHFAKVSLLK